MINYLLAFQELFVQNISGVFHILVQYVIIANHFLLLYSQYALTNVLATLVTSRQLATMFTRYMAKVSSSFSSPAYITFQPAVSINFSLLL